jgi:hypothetical protein
MATTDEFLIGKRERMSWIVETTYGSGGTMSSGEIVGLDCTIEPDFSQGWQEILTAGADNRSVQGRVKGPLILPYNMSFIPYNWRWLKYLLDVADGTDGAVKTHTFTLGNSLDSYKLEWAKRHTTNHVLTLIGNFVKSATLNFQKASGEGSQGFLRVNLTCVAQNSSPGSSVTSLSNISDDGFQYRNIQLTINSTEIPELNNGDITLDNDISEDDSRYCNTTYDNLIGDPIPKTNRISGRFNINLKDKSYYDLWAAGTVVGGTNTLLIDRDGTGNDQLLVTFSDLVIHKAIPPTNLQGVTNVDLIWTADSATIVARDAVSTY